MLKQKPETLEFNGQQLFWPGWTIPRSYRASSGLFEGTTRCFFWKENVYYLQEDYRCTWYEKEKDRGPVPTGLYKVATTIPKDLYATVNPKDCGLVASESVQKVPRAGDPNTPEGTLKRANECERYWSNWGYNRTALIPIGKIAAPQRAGFYLHDSAKGYTHGCIEVEQRFFNDLVSRIKQGLTELHLKIRYDADFMTYGGTSSSGQHDRQRFVLRRLKEMCDFLVGSLDPSRKIPKSLKLSPPPQDRLIEPDWLPGGGIPAWGYEPFSSLPEEIQNKFGGWMSPGPGRTSLMASSSFR